MQWFTVCYILTYLENSFLSQFILLKQSKDLDVTKKFLWVIKN